LVCEATGIPAVVVVTEVFVNLACTAARAHGLPGMRLVALPHPLESRPEAEVRAIARARMRDLLAPLATDRH
jgi:hypothetical protein